MKKHFECSMIKLLKEKCIDQITINELIQEVGSCKGTFYKYYVDKYDLCNKCLSNNVYDKINFEEEDWEKFLVNYVDVLDHNAKIIVNAFASGDINAPIRHNQRAISDVLARILRNQGVDVEDGANLFVLDSCGSIITDVVYSWLKLGRKTNKTELIQRIRAIMPKSVYAYVYREA